MDFNDPLTDAEPVSEGLADPSVPTETPVPETPRRCQRCGAEVPQDAGKCLECGIFQKNNAVAVTHGLRRARFTPVETARRDELMEQLFAERGGRQNVDTLTRFNIQEYAELTVHIDRIDEYLGQIGTLTKAGRQPACLKTRLDLSARRDSIAARIRGEASSDTRPSSPSGLEQVPTSALNAAADLLTRQIAGETLSERELGRLDVLQDAMAGRVTLPPDSTGVPVFDAPVNTRVEGDGLLFLEPGDVGYVETPSKPPSEPQCAYGCGSLTTCAEIKEAHRGVWDTLHALDPQEIARRDREHRDDEADARQFMATGLISSRMRATAEARQPTMSEEEKRQAEKRRQLGWDEGVLNETTGYRRHE